VKVFAIIAAVVIALVIIMLVTGGPGGHGPSRHTGGPGGPTLPASVTDDGA
jgi:hypothetical protein